MNDVEFNNLIRRQALLTVALNEAEKQADERMPWAGKGRAEYEAWRSWVLILKAVSRELAVIAEQIGLDPEDLRLYLSGTQRTDHQFLALAETTVSSYYQDRLHVQDILMASAFDLARQAVKKMVAEILGQQV